MLLLGFFDLDRWQEIWATITHNKSRSILTAFGVFWGMFMLVAMVGAGAALKQGMNSQIEGFATNSCFVWSEQTSEPYQGFKKGRNWNIQNDDLPVLINNIPEIQYLAPVLFGNSGTNNVTRNDKAGSFSVKGNYPAYNKIDESKLIYGRYINDIDIAEQRKVCVIGERVYEVLFPTKENPIGKNIQVNGIYFQVIGVAQHLSTINIGGEAKETVILPFSTMQQAFNQGNNVHFLAVTALPGIQVSVIEEKIQKILKTRNNIAPTDKTAVGGMNIEDQFTMFLYLGIGIASLIWFVGAGTLIAGGIGISNIMLVTVRERTKEIGIRRALGATPNNIISQIMTESIVLTLLAGLAGLMVGVGLLYMVGVALSQGDQFFKDPQISFSVAMLSFFILLIIGTLAGFLPAKRAMNIKPIEAIREE
ncbi:MAG: ABC transporter ATP-binding protein [Porphyromonadaceae bacterium CG2_30_38_12]|nr:MAG: ABC transporter ATP-binding protein [Porphyromonadaceae bacterium CG2_30_38_12]